jgi:hypothetical protein
MKSVRPLQIWQTTIQLRHRLVQKVVQGQNLMVLPIRPLHTPTTREEGRGADEGTEVAEVEKEGGEGGETIIREIAKGLRRKPRADIKAGRKWVGQTISRHVYVESSRLII